MSSEPYVVPDGSPSPDAETHREYLLSSGWRKSGGEDFGGILTPLQNFLEGVLKHFSDEKYAKVRSEVFERLEAFSRLCERHDAVPCAQNEALALMDGFQTLTLHFFNEEDLSLFSDKDLVFRAEYLKHQIKVTERILQEWKWLYQKALLEDLKRNGPPVNCRYY